MTKHFTPKYQPTIDQYITQLVLDGRIQEAQQMAAQYVALYKEDPTQGAGLDAFNGKCQFCEYVFIEDRDCQHEVLGKIACDRCFLDMGGGSIDF